MSTQRIAVRIPRNQTDPDAQAFITAAGITDTTQKSAINTLVTNLKAYGIWTKMKALYPMVGGTAVSHKFNLKDPRDLNAAFRLQFNGGWTHSANGALPNGTNTYANTFLSPSTSLGLNSTHISYYSRTNSNGAEIEMGVELFSLFIEARTSGISYYRINGSSLIQHNDTDSRAFYIGNRRASNVLNAFKNGVKQVESTGGPNSLSANPVYIGALGAGSGAYFTTKQCAFASIGDGLTDTEASNFYTAVQAFQTTLGRQVGVPIVSDSDAQAFLNAAVIDDVTQANAINNLVIGMKADGLWTKMKALYPMVGGTSTTHKFNLKDPRDLDAAFRLVFNGGWTHSANGALPNGTNAYANTFLTPSTNLNLNSHSYGIYSRTNNTSGTQVYGSTDLTNFLTNNLAAGNFVDGTSAMNLITYTANPSTSLLMASRTSNTVFRAFRAGVFLNQNTNNITALPDRIFYLGARNGAGAAEFFNNHQLAFAFLADGLTDTEAANFYTRVQAFQTTLGRQV
jgi:hypothetical protein